MFDTTQDIKIAWHKPIPLQPENIKDDVATESLVLSLLELGYVSKLTCGQVGDDIYILDGHQRQTTLKIAWDLVLYGKGSQYAKTYPKALRYTLDNDVQLQEEISVTLIPCKNLTHAKQILAALCNPYSKTNTATLIEFINKEVEGFNFDILPYDENELSEIETAIQQSYDDYEIEEAHKEEEEDEKSFGFQQNYKTYKLKMLEADYHTFHSNLIFLKEFYDTSNEQQALETAISFTKSYQELSKDIKIIAMRQNTSFDKAFEKIIKQALKDS